jgi:hypothetical protein
VPQRKKLGADHQRTTIVIRSNVWKRARVFAVTHDLELQELVSLAIEEYIDRRDA